MDIIYLEHYKGNEKLGIEAIPPIGVVDSDDAGIDLRAAISHTINLDPGESVVIPSGIKLHIGSHTLHNIYSDIGIYGAIVPRSGLGFKHFLRLANTIGIIDAGFQNEIMIKIRNEGDERLSINRGDRICQMVFHFYVKNVEFNEVDNFGTDTTRSLSGIGSSGVR